VRSVDDRAGGHPLRRPEESASRMRNRKRPMHGRNSARKQAETYPTTFAIAQQSTRMSLFFTTSGTTESIAYLH
jgi:hypothetical protein